MAAGCDHVLIDKASGKLARRPELDEALLVAREGVQLVITKLDRLGRSLEHLTALSGELQARGVDLVVLDQGTGTSTALGRMFSQILGAIAELEHAFMSERTPDGLAAARARAAAAGRRPSSPPTRPRSPRTCRRNWAPTGAGSTPWARSPSSSGSPGPPSTATFSLRGSTDNFVSYPH